MNEQLIEFETAKLAKKVGFNEKCEFQYLDYEDGHKLNGILKDFSHPYSTETPKQSNDSFSQGGYCTAPSQSLLQRWLREVHNIHIVVERASDMGNETYNDKDYEFIVTRKLFSQDIYDRKYYNTYEECLEKALEIALNLLK